MPSFIRAFAPGGTFFFTVVTYHRRPLFQSALCRRLLREALQSVRKRRPFEMEAIVLLSDHLHCLWRLPKDDADFSTRWRKIKQTFTESFLASGGKDARMSAGQARKGLRGVWQPRFWEHTIRDDRDYEQHVHYIHFNPIKHGYVQCAHAWDWSSFRSWLARRMYWPNWCCACDGKTLAIPDFSLIDEGNVE